jgi:hypothetical protein
LIGTSREHVGIEGKRKRIKARWVHAECSHWRHEISILRTIGHMC